jgi:hypothetical protein
MLVFSHLEVESRVILAVNPKTTRPHCKLMQGRVNVTVHNSSQTTISVGIAETARLSLPEQPPLQAYRFISSHPLYHGFLAYMPLEASTLFQTLSGIYENLFNFENVQC